MAYSRIRFEIQNSATMTLVHLSVRDTEKKRILRVGVGNLRSICHRRKKIHKVQRYAFALIR